VHSLLICDGKGEWLRAAAEDCPEGHLAAVPVTVAAPVGEMLPTNPAIVTVPDDRVRITGDKLRSNVWGVSCTK